MKKSVATLTARQQYLLEKFILEFLPSRGNERKNPGNEMEFIHKTITRIFKKYFGFPVSFTVVYDSFVKLEYDTFTMGGNMNWDTKRFVPSQTGNSTKSIHRSGEWIDVYDKLGVAFIYVDVDAFRVRALRNTTITLPLTTAPEKLQIQQELLRQLAAFKIKHLAAE